MPKFKTLPNSVLKEILRAHELPTTGVKAEMVSRLSESLETDEIDSNVLDTIMNRQSETLVQQQIDMLREALEKVVKTVEEMAVSTVRNETAGNAEATGTVGDRTANVPAEVEVRNDGVSSTPEHLEHQCSRNISVTSAIDSINDQSGLARTRPKISEVAELLPEFDPSTERLTSCQFIAKVDSLVAVYGWHPSVVLCAVHSKLKGHARTWLDGQAVFNSWEQFSSLFMNDFPSTCNAAEIHIQMMKSCQLKGESTIEFYYRMVALGRQGRLDDTAIITHIINGLTDEAAKKTLNAIQYAKCPDFFKALVSMSSMTKGNRQEAANARPKESSQTETMKIQQNVKEGPRCYNCNERGHIASKCPQPRKKLKCTVCNRMGHEAKNCYTATKPTVSTVQASGLIDQMVAPIFKTVSINGVEYDGFVDTGSSHSLMEKSLIPMGVQLHPTAIELEGFGGAVVESYEAFTTSVTIDKDDCLATFYVIAEGVAPHPVVLGRNVLCRANKDIIIMVDTIALQTPVSESTGTVMTVSQVNEQTEFDIGSDLTTDERNELVSILHKFDSVFAEDVTTIGRSRSTSMKIEVTTNEPIVGKRYQIPYAQRGVLSNILGKLRKQNIIRPSSSKHAASVVLVKKANGEKRMCVDYRALNAVTVKRHYPMPMVDEQLSRLYGGVYFTILDMTSGYYQIPMEEGSKQYTAFATHEGLFEHNVMPFGLVNAPMQFQEMVVSNVLSKLSNRKNVISYVDEIIIATRTAKEGTFMKNRVKFLGHIVSAEGTQPSKEKTESIDRFPVPTTVHEIRQFLGLTGYFRKFVEGYGHKAEPLTKLLKKHVPFEWGEKQAEAFDALKTALTSEPVLALYNPEKPHEVHTDASSVGLSGILMQVEEGNIKPVFYYSRQCTDTERNYASHELEVLAVVDSVERFRLYLLGSEFIVVTDCNAIVTTKAISPLPARIARWWLKLQEFDFKFVHRPGSAMAHVDGMSRIPTLAPRNIQTVANHVLALSPIVPTDWIFAMQLQDEKIRDIIHQLEEKSSSKQLRQDYVIHHSRLYRLVNGEKRLVIPQAIRWRITRSSHDDAGHFGVDKTMERINSHFWFPRVRRYVKAYIDSCPECCYNKAKGGKAEGELYVSEVQPLPFRTLHMDHLGPFKKSKQGNLYIIACVCAFSKYTILRAVRNTKTAPVIKLIRDMMSYFGQPMQLVTDRGTAYTSKEFADYLSKWGITHVKNAVRTPRANGQVERLNRTILAALKCSTNNNNDWESVLPTLQWTINSQKNATTKFTPNDLVFNFKLKNVSENRIIQSLLEDDRITPTEIEAMKLQAAENINSEKAKWKRRFDERHRSPHTYEVGDLVVVDYVPSATGQSHKLDPLYKGPYIVTKVLNKGRYVVEDLPDAQNSQRRYVGVRVADHLKPWCQLTPEIDELSLQEDEDAGRAEL